MHLKKKIYTWSVYIHAKPLSVAGIVFDGNSPLRDTSNAFIKSQFYIFRGDCVKTNFLSWKQATSICPDVYTGICEVKKFSKKHQKSKEWELLWGGGGWENHIIWNIAPPLILKPCTPLLSIIKEEIGKHRYLNWSLFSTVASVQWRREGMVGGGLDRNAVYY